MTFLVALLFFIVALPSWLLMLVCGQPLISWLKGLKGMKWSPREDTPDSHLQKAGTPSMGGIGIIGSTVVGLLVLASAFFVAVSIFKLPGSPSYFVIQLFPGLLCAVVTLHALLGFVDDWSKARGKGGLLARQKLAGQVVLAVAFLAVLFFTSDFFTSDSQIWSFDSSQIWSVFRMPVLSGFKLWAVLLVMFLVIVGTSNAVNIADGIDGLVAGLTVQCSLSFVCILFSSMAGTSGGSSVSPSVSIFWLALGGACLGFLAYNKFPAKVFMGDTGSLAIGAALGASAIMAHCVFLLPFIGFIFYVETASVIIQVAYFKYTKKKYGEGQRIFRRAPLHHHFELAGWSERRVVWTFWGINALTSVVGLLLMGLGILPRFP